ncbi:hypothetical protein J7T55_006106 [Diaporthe amygdali]|uniref:uncharacterized protein n=1 Tax=Phomopsis amygdali TaxID=1214568 RepID=UPI0022FEDECF|nr:uncharacterized protein J7T55_006106 [Diaporthe amygdali]KAJ0124765.1 hypothetical protein J7T55_006106 [Diaporthe amygdali]
MDYSYGAGRPPGRRYQWCLPCTAVCGLLTAVTLVVVSLVSWIDHAGPLTPLHRGCSGDHRDVPRPGYPGAPDPDEQFAIMNEKVPEELVSQEGQLHVRGNKFARRYAQEELEEETDQVQAGEAIPPPFGTGKIKLPKLPIPSDILDIPVAIPTRIEDIISMVPTVAVPTDVGDILSALPTDPGVILSDLPVPTLPTIPDIPEIPEIIPTTLPTLPFPIPVIPTGIDPPDLPIPTDLPDLPDLPGWPVPTDLPDAPKKPKYGLWPDYSKIPQRILAILKKVVGNLATDQETPKPIRHVLRLVDNILSKVGGGATKPVPSLPPLPVPTLPIPTTTTKAKPALPTLPRPTRSPRPWPPPGKGKDKDGQPGKPDRPKWPPRPRPTGKGKDKDDLEERSGLGLAAAAAAAAAAHQKRDASPEHGFVRKRDEGGGPVDSILGGGDVVEGRDVAADAATGDDKPLSEKNRKKLMAAVRKEILTEIEWADDPLGGLLSVPAAMAAFEAVYRVAEAWKADDAAERESLLQSFASLVDYE